MPNMKKLLVVLSFCLAPVFAWAETPIFEADEALQTNARKWAKEFIEFTKGTHELQLDFSLQSIKYLDDIANDLHQTYIAEKPPEEQVIPVARALGSYLAEVYRIFNGGSWGWVELESGSFPGIQTTKGSHLLPLAKSLDRIKTGTDPDLWEYFQLMTQQ